MPSCISNESPIAGPAPFSTDTDTCDPSVMSCAPAGEARASEPIASITLEPVPITGELGTLALVEKFGGTEGKPDCSIQELSVALSCGNAAATAVWALASAPTLIGLVGGAAATFIAGANCGKDLALLDACEQPKWPPSLP
jgi:hypothetical protein